MGTSPLVAGGLWSWPQDSVRRQDVPSTGTLVFDRSPTVEQHLVKVCGRVLKSDVDRSAQVAPGV